MSAAADQAVTRVQVLAGAASQAPWCDCGPGIEVKVLAIDHDNHSVEYLARTQPGHTTGLHHHHAEAYIFILEGSVTNVTTGCEFRRGDFCYQPVGDRHEEVTGPDGAMAYVSQRGDSDLMADFLDESGAVIFQYTLSDFARIMG
ncbi:MAG: cupin domain-containing protein [Gammaproteobacteria bacterium]